jgi:hypothetical protein
MSHPFGSNRGGVHTADPLEVNEPLVVDVPDHQSDLIRVAIEHDLGVSTGIENRDRIAVGVGADLVGVLAGVLAPDALSRRLKTAG